MSGGSYNYLCTKDSAEIFDNLENLKSMHERLSNIPGAEYATKKTKLLIDMVDVADEIINELEGVWQAVEWVDSCDWGHSEINNALSKLESKK